MQELYAAIRGAASTPDGPFWVVCRTVASGHWHLLICLSSCVGLLEELVVGYSTLTVVHEGVPSISHELHTWPNGNFRGLKRLRLLSHCAFFSASRSAPLCNTEGDL
ncbi:hypothetical protein M378DRAFT_167192 [Amanita muscaria Koide BX008]|uniref:Uncharacterized protein n=1 Tax=Amanita muscaria (strain Koide BX008) TaxID=946122 RepID=A0A0C2SDT3_AMAMK|nr:hypothetical protein M378DRAFT_167192 [Amanita muscaria Koide BX008]